MTDRLLTPSKITAWLGCAHHLTLSNRVDEGLLAHPETAFGSFARLLADKGLEHEADCLEAYRSEGKSILEVAPRDVHETFAAWVDRLGDPFAGGHDVIYQMPLIHNGVRGIADFLIRVLDPHTGVASYEPVDAKLARADAKPGHVLQLCFYADALEAITGVAPRRVHLWLGSGKVESLLVDEFRPYWNRLRSQLTALLDDDPAHRVTVPEPCSYCEFCEFFEVCTAQWRGEDSLVYVAGLRQQERPPLVDAGAATLAALATREAPVDGIRPERLQRIIGQAALQVEAREAPDAPPPYRLIEGSADPTWGQGFTLLPEPDDGDVFLDFEGHPFWRADTGLFFLFGYIAREADGEWHYHAFWAHDLAEEATATRALIDVFVHRRVEHPGMHVYHYNHTERSALERLTAEHGVAEVALAELVETGLFVDLLVVARNALQLGAESYGLKDLERLTAFERGHDIDAGAGAVIEYEEFTKTRDQASLTRIAAYNEDDVRATRALRNWLLEHRPAGTDWRAAVLETVETDAELDEQVTALHAFGPDTPEHLLGDVLGYWRRERRAQIAPKLVQCEGDEDELLDEPEALAGLSPIGMFERTDKHDKPILPGMRFRLPAQETKGFKGGRGQVVYATPGGLTGSASVVRLDVEGGEVDLTWNDRAQELGVLPSVVVLDDWIDAKPKPTSLADLAARMLDPLGTPNPVSVALLRRDLPAFTPGHGPRGGEFRDDLAEMKAWVCELDHSYVAVQGPPGTGKTYRGSHLIHRLILAGKRVGITAMSHRAIDNLLNAVVDVFEEAGHADRLHTVRRVAKKPPVTHPHIKHVTDNKPCTKAGYNLVAGTTWLFASDEMLDAPVDVLVVDEAGQLALADALAASRSAHNLVLLGDPLQLPQVAQATHPGGGGSSVLEHILGDDVTMPAERGVFLDETRRMHPDVCRFISEQIYEGRLTSHPSCAAQTTEFGTGPRWLRAQHTDRSTEAPEEAELVAAEICRLIGTEWTNEKAVRAPLTTGDFMVVAPFNDQVHLIRERLDRDELTRGIPVGTVDKFQGQQAAVVFFTMTTSSAADMTRGADFLFSRNRLNVAVSRARCLAYLVCTEELLNSRARTVEEMRLISTLCSLVEHCP